MRRESVLVTLLKTHTTIDHRFINKFFKKFKIGGELEFHIPDKDVVSYLGVEMKTLRDRLRNKYSKNINFVENVDYIKLQKPGRGNLLTYMLNYKCFERLAMSGDSQQSESVRVYFTKLREFLTEHQEAIYQAVENKKDLSAYSRFESIYFFAVDDKHHPDVFKVGRSSDIVARLRNYNVGRIKEVDLKYLAIVKNSILIENCISQGLDKYRVFKDKEIYKVKPALIKKITDACYCKNVSKQENEDLYRELSDLLALYAYTKNKVRIQPYVVIGKDVLTHIKP